MHKLEWQHLASNVFNAQKLIHEMHSSTHFVEVIGRPMLTRRKAVPSDTGLIQMLIYELAEFDHEDSQVGTTETDSLAGITE